MGFKEDADFARFVSMGAIATDAVRRHLTEEHGHHMVELERYAMANKVWQTKVKRLRLPDLLCVRCGLRVESRGKSQLGIVLSHSRAAGRGWDEGGMRPDDLYAFLRVDIAVDPPTTSTPAYFRTSDLSAESQHVRVSTPKASSQGSEVTYEWTSWVPGKAGTFEHLDEKSRIVCRWDDGGSYRYYQWGNWPARHLYLVPGEGITAKETIVAGIVAPPGDTGCSGGIWDPFKSLRSEDPADRYTAVRAAGILERQDLIDALKAIIDDAEEDWRIKLEAAAGLARMQPGLWTASIAQVATDPDALPEQRMESVFVLSEIATEDAALALAEVATSDPELPSELRAAAVWGLGQGASQRPDLILELTVDEDDFVALHAIAAIPWLSDQEERELVGWLSSSDDRRSAAAAQLLMRHHAIRPLLRATELGGRSRLWALRALGDLSPDLVRQQGAELLTADLAEALSPLWVAGKDWLRIQGAEGLSALDVQKVRFNPLT